MKFAKPNLQPNSTCPTCGYVMNASSCADTDPRPPEPGDISLCLCCGELLVFDQEMLLRVPSIGEIMDFSPANYEMIERTQRAIRAVRPLQHKLP